MKLNRSKKVFAGLVVASTLFMVYKVSEFYLEQSRTKALIELDKKLALGKTLSSDEKNIHGASELMFINSVLKGEPNWSILEGRDDISTELLVIMNYRKCIESRELKACEIVKDKDSTGFFEKRVLFMLRHGSSDASIDNTFKK